MKKINSKQHLDASLNAKLLVQQLNLTKTKQLIKKLNFKQALTIYQSVAEYLDDNQKSKAIQLLGLVEKNPNNSDFLGSKIKEMQHLIKDDMVLFQKLLVYFAKILQRMIHCSH